MVGEIGIMEVIGFTFAAVVMGLGVGYFLVIRPKLKAVKEERELSNMVPRAPVAQVPMGELPQVITDAELDSLLEKKPEGE